MSKTPDLEYAKKVVINLLKLDSKDGTDEKFFLVRHRNEIYEKLEHIYEAQSGGSLVFIAESLPVINGIVHVGSKFEDLKEATDWVKKEFSEDVNPLSILSALTFLYIVYTGVINKGTEKWILMYEAITKKLTSLDKDTKQKES